MARKFVWFLLVILAHETRNAWAVNDYSPRYRKVSRKDSTQRSALDDANSRILHFQQRPSSANVIYITVPTGTTEPETTRPPQHTYTTTTKAPYSQPPHHYYPHPDVHYPPPYPIYPQPYPQPYPVVTPLIVPYYGWTGHPPPPYNPPKHPHPPYNPPKHSHPHSHNHEYSLEPALVGDPIGLDSELGTPTTAPDDNNSTVYPSNPLSNADDILKISTPKPQISNVNNDENTDQIYNPIIMNLSAIELLANQTQKQRPNRKPRPNKKPTTTLEPVSISSMQELISGSNDFGNMASIQIETSAEVNFDESVGGTLDNDNKKGVILRPSNIYSQVEDNSQTKPKRRPVPKERPDPVEQDEVESSEVLGPDKDLIVVQRKGKPMKIRLAQRIPNWRLFKLPDSFEWNI